MSTLTLEPRLAKQRRSEVVPLLRIMLLQYVSDNVSFRAVHREHTQAACKAAVASSVAFMPAFEQVLHGDPCNLNAAAKAVLLHELLDAAWRCHSDLEKRTQVSSSCSVTIC